MRSVQRTAQFRRDFKRVKRGAHGSHLDKTLVEALELLFLELPRVSRRLQTLRDWSDETFKLNRAGFPGNHVD